MDVSIRELRANTKEILDTVRRGKSVTIKSRGNACAVLVPLSNKKQTIANDPAFGMWEDRSDFDDVAQYVRELRKGRKL